MGRIITIPFLLLLVLGVNGRAQEQQMYTDLPVFGWTVKINNILINQDTTLLRKTLGNLGKELHGIAERLSPNALQKLQRVKIWLEQLLTMYFGHNDYYPNDRADLKNYDPIGYGLIEQLWNVKDGVPVETPQNGTTPK